MSGAPHLDAPTSTTQSRSLKPFLIACLLVLAIMEGLGTYVVNLPGRSPDFRTFYAAGYLLRTDRAHFYDTDTQTRIQNALVSPARLTLYFNHPAYEAVVDAPFALLPFRWAYRAFMVFNALLMAACAFAARRPLSRLIPWLQPRPGFALLLFAPLLLALAQGQDSILFLLLACLCWHQLERGDDLTAGLILALALFRFQLAIPMAMILTARRGARFASGFIAGTAAVISLCVALVGVTGMRSLLRLVQLTSTAGNGQAAPIEIIMYPPGMANLRGLLYVCLTRWLPPHAGIFLVAAASLSVLLYGIVRAHQAAELETAFAIATLGAILVSYHLFFHDATLLVLALVMLAGRVPPWLLLVAYITPAVALLLLGIGWYWIASIPMLALLFVLRHRIVPVTSPCPA